MFQYKGSTADNMYSLSDLESRLCHLRLANDAGLGHVIVLKKNVSFDDTPDDRDNCAD